MAEEDIQLPAVSVGEEVHNGESLPDQNELQRRLRISIGTIVREQRRSPLSLLPAATEAHADLDHVYHHFWVRDGSIDALKLIESENGIAQESAKRILQGMFKLFEGEVYERGFQVQPKEQDGVWHIDPQAGPPIHRTLDGGSYAWYGNNQPDSFGEFLIAVKAAHDRGISLGEDGSDFSPEQQQTLVNMTQYLQRLNIWKFECSSMWENEQVYNPSPLSTVAIVAKGLEDIMSLLSKIDPEKKLEGRDISECIVSCREAIRHGFETPEGRKFPFPMEKTEQYHPGDYDLATMVAFDIGALDFLGPQAYLAYRENAYEELGTTAVPGGLRRFKGDGYYARKRDGTINTEPMDREGKEQINEDGTEAVWLMAVAMDIKMLTRVCQDTQSITREEARLLLSQICQEVAFLEKIYEKYNMYPELLTPALGNHAELEPNDNDLLWNHAVIIGAFAELQKTFYP